MESLPMSRGMPRMDARGRTRVRSTILVWHAPLLGFRDQRGMGPTMTEQYDATEISRRIIESTTLDAVIYADRSGIIRLWNDAAETIFGHSAQDAIGQSLDLIIPEKHQDAHWTGWDKVMRTKETKYGLDPLAAPGITADGKRVSLEFSITMLVDADGEIEGIAAVLRDVSKRWEKEKELRMKVRELEKNAATHNTSE